MSRRATRTSGKRKADEPAKAPAAAEKPAKSKRSQKAAKQEVEEQESAFDLFMKEIAQREKRLQKHCIIMEMVDTEEDETTLEQLRALKRVFVPEQVQEDFIEIWSELDEVGQSDDEDEEDDDGGEGEEAGEDEAGGEDGEGEEGEEKDIGDDATMKAFMKMFLGKCLTTRHSAEMQTILEKHLDFIDESIKADKWQAAFCRWVATVMAARREPHWWEDTDMPDDALEVYDRLRLQWIKIKDISDEELGGLVSEMDGVDVKTELTQYLQDMADEMKQMDYKVEDVVQKAKQQKKGKAKKQNTEQQAAAQEGRAAEDEQPQQKKGRGTKASAAQQSNEPMVEQPKKKKKKSSVTKQTNEAEKPAAKEKVAKKRKVQEGKQESEPEQLVQEQKQTAKKQKASKEVKAGKAAAQKSETQQQAKQRAAKKKAGKQ